MQWHQCARCLNVSSTTIFNKDWEATLLTCQQHADAARASILNATIRDFCNKAIAWTNKTCAKAQDQMVLDITNGNPPPLSADPCIIDWIKHLAEQGKLEAENKATMAAAEDAQAIYEQQLTISNKALEEDLQKIHDHTAVVLANARDDINLKITKFKANLKVQHE
jgi:hypothetical protein